MTSDLEREFLLHSEAALQILRNIPESGSHRNVFSIIVMPSFAPSYCCTLYAPLPFAKKAKPLASITTWRSDVDLEKFSNPVERLKHPTIFIPTIESEAITLNDGEAEDFQRRIRGVSIPLYLSSAKVLGCDGTSFEFVSNEFFYGVSIRWWEDQPVEWRPFTEAILQIVTELESRRSKH